MGGGGWTDVGSTVALPSARTPNLVPGTFLVPRVPTTH